MPEINHRKPNKKFSYIGIDGINFEMSIDDVNIYLEYTPLKHSDPYNWEFGNITIKNGRVYIFINLPKLIYASNINSYGKDLFSHLKNDTIYIENKLKDFLCKIIGDDDCDIDILSARVKSIECNMTNRISPRSTCSQVINLLNRCLYRGTNVVYQSASDECKYYKENETLINLKKNYYTIKCYDKSLQQQVTGNSDVEDGLLRIEVAMKDRTLKKLFKNKCTVRDILTKKGLNKVINEYKRIFIEEIKNEYILPCLNNVTKILFESLKKTNSPVETIARHRELIMDEEILRKALKRWYNYKGVADNSRKIIYDYKSYNFPKGVITTLKQFAESCKKVKKNVTN